MKYSSFEIEKNNILSLKEVFPLPIAYALQTHQDKIFVANSEKLFDEEADAIITQEKNLALLIQTADCLALQVFDPENKVIAHIHAGWRGQSKKIVSKTVQTLIEKFHSDPQKLVVQSRPSLGGCCAEFSDPFQELPEWMHPYIQENKHVNLKKALEQELLENGILPENISIDMTCSCCSPLNLPSYRRDKTNRRMAHLIWLE